MRSDRGRGGAHSRAGVPCSILSAHSTNFALKNLALWLGIAGCRRSMTEAQHDATKPMVSTVLMYVFVKVSYGAK